MDTKYSVVIPFHNEEKSVQELYQKLDAVMSNRFEPVEFVLVDDHSTDQTQGILNEIAALDSRVVVIRLKRNFGQTGALAAGFDYAHGEIIISMDGDLQHDPEEIPEMLRVFQETGSDIVSGWRKHRADNLIFRQFPSRAANWMIAKISGVNIHDFGTTFKVYKRETIKQIRLYGELHRFIPALASWNGATIVEVPIRHGTRPSGRSHYGISRTIRVIFDLLTVRFLLGYQARPLQFFGPIGLMGIGSGGLIAVWLLFKKVFYGAALFDQHGPLMLLSIVLFLTGIQLISSGLIAELLSRTYFESQNKTIYSVERILRRDEIEPH